MKDDAFCSDSDESAAVEELLSQANDHSVLEQITAINCSGIADSVLPSDLENRFSRLKTFPSYSRSSPSVPRSNNPKLKYSFEPLDQSSNEHSLGDAYSVADASNSPSKPKPDRKKSLESQSKTRSVSSALHSTSSPSRSASFSPMNAIPDQKREMRWESGSFSPPSSYSDSSRNSSPSPPPRGSGCCWCSPRRDWRSRRNRKRGESVVEKMNAMLSRMDASSAKEQKKIMKKIAREEDKVNREAEKIVKWVRQESERMTIPSDGE